MNTIENNNDVNNKPERKRKNLIRLGVEEQMAYQWSRTRMGGWAIAQKHLQESGWDDSSHFVMNIMDGFERVKRLNIK